MSKGRWQPLGFSRGRGTYTLKEVAEQCPRLFAPGWTTDLIRIAEMTASIGQTKVINTSIEDASESMFADETPLLQHYLLEPHNE